MPAPKGHAPYAGCEKGGRPTKYTDEFIEREADAFIEWLSKEDSVWYESFCFERGYTPDMLSMWAKTNEKFSGVYRLSQAWQKQKLITSGLLSKFNSNIVKLVLANTIGWTDKQQISGDSANPLACILDRITNKPQVEDDSNIETEQETA
jgi:hypothetical protein